MFWGCFTATSLYKAILQILIVKILFLLSQAAEPECSEAETYIFTSTSTQTCEASLYTSQLGIMQTLLSVKPVEHYRRVVLNNGKKPQLATVKQQTDISRQ